MNALETHSGIYFDLDNPRPDQVALLDVAIALANTCRFGGHVAAGRYYSVAEHACLVYRLVSDLGADADLCLAALHHDSHEAYVGDIPTPIKRILGTQYRVLCEAVDVAIVGAFGIDPELLHHDVVVEADALALRIEAQTFKASGGIGPHWGHVEPFVSPLRVLGLKPTIAASEFLRCHAAASWAVGHPTEAVAW